MYSAEICFFIILSCSCIVVINAQQATNGQAGAFSPANAVFNQVGLLDSLAAVRKFPTNDPSLEYQSKLLKQLATQPANVTTKTEEQKANDTITDVKKMSEKKPPACSTTGVCSVRKPCDPPCVCSAQNALNNGRCTGSTLGIDLPHLS